MPEKFARAQHADGLSVLDDVRNDRDVLVHAVLGCDRGLFGIAENPRHREQVFVREFLIVKDDEEMIEPRLVNLPRRYTIHVAKVAAVDFRAERAGKRANANARRLLRRCRDR